MLGQIKPNNKSNLTLSVEKQTLDEIKKEAESLGISINAKIGKILDDHVLFGRYMGDHKPIVITPPLFQFLLEGIDDDRLLRSWKITISQINQQILMMHNIPCNLEDFVKYTFMKVGIHVGAFDKCTYTVDAAGNIDLTISHKYGIRWSQSIAQACAEHIQDKFHKTVSFEILPDVIKMRITD